MQSPEAVIYIYIKCSSYRKKEGGEDVRIEVAGLSTNYTLKGLTDIVRSLILFQMQYETIRIFSSRK